MDFNTGTALLDAVVLAVVSGEPEGSYGYRITQEVRKVIDLSESALYPVLRRLRREEYLDVYDREYGGRNRRYYKVTQTGMARLEQYKHAWKKYSAGISELFRDIEADKKEDSVLSV